MGKHARSYGWVEFIHTTMSFSGVRLTHHVSAIFDRVGKVQCTGNPHRFGCITLFVCESPPAGDVALAITLQMSQCYIFLDKRKALSRKFPSVHLSWSFTKYNKILDDSKECETIRKLCVDLLEDRDAL